MLKDEKFPESGTDINATNYKLLACDVRNTEELGRKLVEEYQVDRTLPTLILTECLLVYLKPADSLKILGWCGTFFEGSPCVSILNYEMIDPFDPFG